MSNYWVNDIIAGPLVSGLTYAGLRIYFKDYGLILEHFDDPKLFRISIITLYSGDSVINMTSQKEYFIV
jgi:hypothetical protein